MLLRYGDLVLLALALPAFLIAGWPMLGYAAGGVSYMPMAYCDRGTHDQLAAILAERGQGGLAVRMPLGQPVPLSP